MTEAGGEREGVIRVGSRGSALAAAQTRAVLAALRERHPALRFEHRFIVTEGDRSHKPLPAMGGRGVFVKELEQALLTGEIDLAVHSLKDMTVESVEGLAIAAIPRREEPWDALVSRSGDSLALLPPGAAVGTGSPRRKAFLLAERRDLRVLPLRGNVDTRLAKLDAGEFDAVVLAAAGLIRSGLQARITERLRPPAFLPAPGQGALALQVRMDDEKTRRAAAALHDEKTALAARAERALLRALRGGCHLPLGAIAGPNRSEGAAGGMSMEAALAAPDGSRLVRGRIDWEGDPDEAGRVLAEKLLKGGGASILSDFASS